MKTIPKILLIIEVIFVLSIIYIIRIPNINEITQHEKQIVLAAIKKHGDYPIVKDITTGKIWMERKGKRILINKENVK